MAANVSCRGLYLDFEEKEHFLAILGFAVLQFYALGFIAPPAGKFVSTIMLNLCIYIQAGSSTYASAWSCRITSDESSYS